MEENKKDGAGKSFLHQPITNKAVRLGIILAAIFVTISIGISIGAHSRFGEFNQEMGNYNRDFRGMEGRNFKGEAFMTEGGCGQKNNGGGCGQQLNGGACGQQRNEVEGRQINPGCQMINSVPSSVIPVVTVETSTTNTATSTIK